MVFKVLQLSRPDSQPVRVPPPSPLQRAFGSFRVCESVFGCSAVVLFVLMVFKLSALMPRVPRKEGRADTASQAACGGGSSQFFYRVGIRNIERVRLIRLF